MLCGTLRWDGGKGDVVWGGRALCPAPQHQVGPVPTFSGGPDRAAWWVQLVAHARPSLLDHAGLGTNLAGPCHAWAGPKNGPHFGLLGLGLHAHLYFPMITQIGKPLEIH